MEVTPRHARAIAASGYIFLLPLVQYYVRMYREAIDPSSPQFSGGLGRWAHHRQTVSRESDAMTRHSTTIDSSVWLDVRTHAWTFSHPQIAHASIASVTDLWGFVVYERAGVDPDTRPLLVVPADWVGAVPAGVGPVVRTETAFVHCASSVELADPYDSERVRTIQGDVRVEPVGARAGITPSSPPATGWWPASEDDLTSMDFWTVATFALALVTPNPDDRGIMRQLADIGVEAGARWDLHTVGPSVQEAIEQGMDEALTELMRAARRLHEPVGRSRAEFDLDYFGRALTALASRPLEGLR